MPASNSAKVWEVDPSTRSTRTRGARLRGSVGSAGRARNFEDTRERSERNERLGVYARLIAVAILGGAMLWWPYGRSCGVGLAAYLAATGMIIVGALWVIACTWICRMARTHGLAMLVALWGLGLIAIEVMPRVGYAKAEAAWLCGAASRSNP